MGASLAALASPGERPRFAALPQRELHVQGLPECLHVSSPEGTWEHHQGTLQQGARPRLLAVPDVPLLQVSVHAWPAGWQQGLAVVRCTQCALPSLPHASAGLTSSCLQAEKHRPKEDLLAVPAQQEGHPERPCLLVWQLPVGAVWGEHQRGARLAAWLNGNCAAMA